MSPFEKKQMLGLFKEPEFFLVFVLLHTDGKTRNSLLGLEDMHYRDKAIATAWRDDIVIKLKRIQHLVELEFFQLAHSKLNALFDIVTWTGEKSDGPETTEERGEVLPDS